MKREYTLEEQMEIIKKGGQTCANEIDKILNPIEELQIAAVRKSEFCLRHIENPSVKVQLEAVKHCSRALEYIKVPCYRAQLEAVQRDGNAIQFIKNPSKRIQLEAVKQNGRAIKFIKNPTEEIQLEAVWQIGTAIEFIKNPSETVQLTAVREFGSSIKFIEKPSEIVKLEAVKNHGYAIILIENPTEEMKLEAIKQEGEAIKYIKDPSFEMIVLAIENISYKDNSLNKLFSLEEKYQNFNKNIEEMLSKEDYKILNVVENKEVFVSTIEYLNDSQKEKLNGLISKSLEVKDEIMEKFEKSCLHFKDKPEEGDKFEDEKNEDNILNNDILDSYDDFDDPVE